FGNQCRSHHHSHSPTYHSPLTTHLKLDVHSYRRNEHRAAIAVVGRVEDFLKIARDEDPLDYGQVVERFQDVFGPVMELAVADDEVQAAGSQVFVVGLLQAIDSQGQTNLVVRPAPGCALEQQANIKETVDCGEGPGLRVPVVPAKA